MFWLLTACFLQSRLIQLCCIKNKKQINVKQASMDQKMVGSAIQRLNIYPKDSEIGFPSTYPVDSDLSGK